MVIVFWILFSLWILTAAVTVLVVLVQSGRGGGLSGLAGSGGAISETIGTTGGEKTLNRWTTYCAAGFMVLTILLGLLGDSVVSNKTVYEGGGIIQPAAAPIAEETTAATEAVETTAATQATEAVEQVTETIAPVVATVEDAVAPVAETVGEAVTAVENAVAPITEAVGEAAADQPAATE